MYNICSFSMQPSIVVRCTNLSNLYEESLSAVRIVAQHNLDSDSSCAVVLTFSNTSSGYQLICVSYIPIFMFRPIIQLG